MLEYNLMDFGLCDSILSSEKIITGHINKTFKVCINGDYYIVQIINSNIFKSVKNVMQNISVVCDYLSSRNIQTLRYLTTKEGLNYTMDSNGNYIRVYKYISDSICMDYTNDLEYIYNAGLGFGEFCSNISNISNNTIIDTIPNFHNTKMYLNRLFSVNNNNNNNRVSKAENLLNDIYKLRDYSNIVDSISKRVTHNDIKFSNILFSTVDKSYKCVIDLDTIMNGYLSYDFADGVRSICRNLDNTLNLNKLEAYSKGFLSYPISLEDKSVLVDSIISISLELSARYLYEYLTNGNYFNLSSVEDNYIKSRNYIDFAKDVLSKRKYIKI